jgi:LysM repeat protein
MVDSVATRMQDYYAKLDKGEDVSDFNVVKNQQELDLLSKYSEAPSTVTAFENDPDVIKNYEIVTDYLGNNQTVMKGLADPASLFKGDKAEFMRDEFRISTLINRAMTLEDAPEEVKVAYNNLRDDWNNAKISGIGETLDAVKDYGIDLLFNYETIPMVAATIYSGGTALGANAAARTGLKAALQKGLAAASNNPVKYGAAYGGIFGSAADISSQNLNISLDNQDEINFGQTALVGTLGAGLGAGISYGLSKVGSKIAQRRLERDTELDNTPPLSESKGMVLFNEGIEGEYIPKSGGEIIDRVDRLLTGKTGRIVDIEDGDFENIIDDFVEDIGGGATTRDEVENIVIGALKSGETGKKVKNKIAFELWKTTTQLLGTAFVGKSSGILTSYVPYSKTAESLRQRLSFDFGIGVKNTKEQVGMDFGEVARNITGGFRERYKAAIEPLALNTVKGTLEDDVNAALNRAIRGQLSPDKTINIAATKIQNLFKDIGDELFDLGLIDRKVENYIPRMWNRKAIENNQNDFARLLVEEGEAADLVEAERIIKEMLDIENQIGGGTSGHFFSAKRKFIDIQNESKFVDFLEDDLLSVVEKYNFQAGKAISKVKVLNSRSEREFIEKWINPIAAEMKAAGRELSRKDRLKIRDLYRLTTGENLERYSDTIQTGMDGYQLATRMAMLPLATVGSITEILINIGRGGALKAAKGFKEASEVAYKTITNDLHTELKNRHGLTANEVWRELQSFGKAVDQSVGQLGNRLAGDDLIHEGLQKASNKFFRLNLLDQWTKFVQIASYSTGKSLIEDNLNAIAAHGSKARTKKIETMIGELNDLGVDYQKGVAWVNSGAKRTDDFYKEFTRGAARYVDGVILQPNAMSNLKPMLYSNPKTTILFQLLGYPAAFTNTILKGAAKSLVKDPVRNTPKILGAALSMTAAARFMNWVRSRGESEAWHIDEADKNMKAIARWGGNGLFLDTFTRAKNAAMYGDNILGYATMPFGPVAGEALNLFQGKPAQVLGNKVPFVGAGNIFLGPEMMRKYRKSLKELDRDLNDKFVPDFPTNVGRDSFSIGGKIGQKLGSELAEVLDASTEGLFKPELLNKTAKDIKNEVTLTADLEKYSPDLADDIALSNMALDDVDLEDYILTASRSVFNDHNANDELVQLSEVVDPDYTLYDSISSHLNKLNDKKINLLRPKYASAKDIEGLENLTNYVSHYIRSLEPYKDVTTEGAKKAAKQHIARIIDQEDKEIFNFIKETASITPAKIVRSLEDAQPSIGIKERNKLKDEFVKDSVIKTPVYRGVSSFNDYDYEIAFPFPRETGVHFGTEGQANYQAMKSFNEYEVIENFAMTKTVDKGQFDNFFREALIEAPDQEIPPMSVLKGYLNIKNPLVIEHDMSSWDAANLLTYEFNDLLDALTENTKGKSYPKELFEDLKKLSMKAMKIKDNYVKKENTDRKEGIQTKAIENKLMFMLENNKLTKDFQNILKRFGFDGIKYFNEVEPSFGVGSFREDNYSYIAFDPSQFKIESSSRFNPKDPRDRKSEGGSIVARALGISDEALSWAKSQRNRFPKKERFDGVGDAAAHLALGFITQQAKNPTAALLAANARELITFDRIGGRMDIFNNNLGATIKASNYEDAEKIIDSLISDRKAMFMTPQESRMRRGYAEGGESEYTVKKGDTLSAIAKNTGNTIEAIMSINNIDNPDLIYVDQKIAIPMEKDFKENKILSALQRKRKQNKILNALRNKKNKVTNFIGSLKKGANNQVIKNFADFFNPFQKTKTEKDYNPKVIDALRFATINALNKGKNNIDYDDYNLKESNVKAQVASPDQRRKDNLQSRMLSGNITPTEEAAFSVGGATLSFEGDKVFINDVYDFSKINERIATALPDNYTKLRTFLGKVKLPTNPYKSKIYMGTINELRQGFNIGGKIAQKLAPKLAEGFYSPLEKAALNVKREKGLDTDFLNELKAMPKITKDELEFSGIEESLSKNKKINREEFEDIVKNSRIQINTIRGSNQKQFDEFDEFEFEQVFEEIGLDAIPEKELEELVYNKYQSYDKLEKFKNGLMSFDEQERFFKTMKEDYIYTQKKADQFAEGVVPENVAFNTQYDKYTSAGDLNSTPINYREILLSVKSENPKFSKKANRVRFYDNEVHWGNEQILIDHSKANPDNVIKTVAHLRVADGFIGDKTGLIIEEMQSDLHKAAREVGYLDETIEPKLSNKEQEEIIEEIEQKLVKEYDDIEKKVKGFKKEYTSYDYMDDLMLQSEASEDLLKQNFSIEDIDMFNKEYTNYVVKNNPLFKQQGDIQDELKNLTSIQNDKRDAFINKRNELAQEMQQNKEDLLKKLKQQNKKLGFTVTASLRNVTPPTEAPFKKSFHKLTLNKALIEAAENNNSFIALTTGKKQVKRYIPEEGITPKSVKNLQRLYDGEFLKALKKFGKDYNEEVKLRSVTVNDEGGNDDFYVLELTEKMKKDILQGRPMFSEGGLIDV